MVMEQKAQEALEASLYHQEEHYKLALSISKIIHDNCKDAPHDIGLKFVDSAFGVSFIQRHLRLGFNDAMKIVEKLESSGLIKRAKNNWQFEVIK